MGKGVNEAREEDSEIIRSPLVPLDPTIGIPGPLGGIQRSEMPVITNNTMNRLMDGGPTDRGTRCLFTAPNQGV